MRLPGAMSALQTSFQVKNSFSHIQRLHNMLYAYGSTVVEIARRKEFGACCCPYVPSCPYSFNVAAFFFQRAQGILEVMAKLTYVGLEQLRMRGC
jgi:autophagy-related protein 11